MPPRLKLGQQQDGKALEFDETGRRRKLVPALFIHRCLADMERRSHGLNEVRFTVRAEGQARLAPAEGRW